MWGDTFWSQGAKSDLVLGKTDISNKSPDDYGKSLPKVMIEVKKQNVVSWEMLVKEQLWNKADSLKNKYGKIWVIAMKGLEICIFRFDVTDYPDNTEHFENFSPLNLNNFSDTDLDDLGIEHMTISYNNTEEVSFYKGQVIEGKMENHPLEDKDITRVISWRLDNEAHHKYIHDMLDYISKNNVKKNYCIQRFIY